MKGFAATILAAGLAGFAGPSFGVDSSTWSYAAAAKWGKLAKEFHLCGTGTMQSPIDIPDKDVQERRPAGDAVQLQAVPAENRR